MEISTRRFREDLQTDEEKQITEVVKAVEKLGADVLLTEVIVKLQEAKNLLADYVDSKKS